jgi:2'-5' RNA ligase
MRLFVAINLPEETRAAVREAVRPLEERGLPARWIDPESYHVTMKFIGEVRPDRGEPYVEVLRRVCSGYRPADLSLEEVGAFPSLRRPNVLWVGVEPTPQLRALKHDLEHGYASLGVDRETRAFRPHVTVARAHDDANAGEFRLLEDLAREIELEASFTAEHLDLMRSRLRSDGAVYSVEREVPLTGGEDEED